MIIDKSKSLHIFSFFFLLDDGRVLKVVNKGQGSKVETVVIEDIQVFPDGYAVTGLKIYRANGKEKLVVISKEKVISVPLHQCEHQESCR